MGTSQSLIMKRRELVSVCASPTAVHQLLDRSGGLDEVEALTPTPVCFCHFTSILFQLCDLDADRAHVDP